MQLGLRTKLTLVMTGLVFLVVVVLSAVFVSRLTTQVIHETNTRANELAQQMFEQAKHSLEDAKQSGERPSSNSAEDRHELPRFDAQLQAAQRDGLDRARAVDLEHVVELERAERQLLSPLGLTPEARYRHR